MATGYHTGWQELELLKPEVCAASYRLKVLTPVSQHTPWNTRQDFSGQNQMEFISKIEVFYVSDMVLNVFSLGFGFEGGGWIWFLRGQRLEMDMVIETNKFGPNKFYHWKNNLKHMP